MLNFVPQQYTDIAKYYLPTSSFYLVKKKYSVLVVPQLTCKEDRRYPCWLQYTQ